MKYKEKKKKCRNAIKRFCSSCETKICNACWKQHQCDRSACAFIAFDKKTQEFLPLCEEHQSLARSICRDCNFKAICVYCDNREHKIHHKCSIAEHGAQSKVLYTALLHKFQPKFTKAKVNYKEEITKLYNFREQMQKELEVRKLEQLKKFYEKVTTEEKKLMKDIDLKISAFTEKLSQNNLIENNQGSAISMYAEEIKTKTDISVVIEQMSILERIDDLSSFHCFSANLSNTINDNELLGDFILKVFKENSLEIAKVVDVKIGKIIEEENKISKGCFVFRSPVKGITLIIKDTLCKRAFKSTN